MAISLIKEFRQKQKISLTPLLKKSIDLLQLSRYELIQKIDREIEINPFVEKEISEDFDTDENYNDSSFDFNVAAVENLRDTLINQINDLRLDENDKGIEVSTIEIKKELQNIINGENKSKPLTDDELTKKINDKGYPIARRTVAKYREAMSIAPSNQRKRSKLYG